MECIMPISVLTKLYNRVSACVRACVCVYVCVLQDDLISVYLLRFVFRVVPTTWRTA